MIGPPCVHFAGRPACRGGLARSNAKDGLVLQGSHHFTSSSLDGLIHPALHAVRYLYYVSELREPVQSPAVHLTGLGDKERMVLPERDRGNGGRELSKRDKAVLRMLPWT